MLTISNNITLGILIFLSILLTILLNLIFNKKEKRQLDKIFIINIGLILFWILCLTFQLVFMELFNANPLYFEYFSYISVCFLPVSFLFMAQIYAKTKINFKKWHYLLFIIPILSILAVWTNDIHHLFYKTYSINFNESIYGFWFYVHYYYTLLLFGISFIILMKYSISNSGFFSKPAILILIGALIPIVTNVLGTINIIPMSIYITPVTIAITIICLTLAIFRFSLFKSTPIALQRIVDRMSDCYIILDENNMVTDFNATFLNMFNVKDADIRNTSVFYLINTLAGKEIDLNKFKDVLNKIKDSSKTVYFDKFFSEYNKYFRIEINTIMSDQNFLGTLILFKDTTQHEHDMKTIRDNQDMLMENERLASLGQLIGGIAHNLKTPIMSIAGAVEGLNDLVKEYDSSVGDPEVTQEDHHEIANDMQVWLEKIKGYTEYMSDIITTVKGQAVTLAAEDEIEFTVKELINRVDILMKHELKNALIYLKVSMQTDESNIIHGDVNSLVQVINNMISNSIQAYNGKSNQNIDMLIRQESNNLIISIRDYAGGLPKKVQDKLFKEMITTKGKNGTGLGLYMSYSNIKARFNGDITFETDEIGTTFNIILPL